MKGKEDLYRLVRGMSRSEKRYFVLDARKSGRSGSKYLALFEALNSMDPYDESALQEQFPKHLASDKRYLYEAILRSMRDYHSQSSRAARIKEYLLDARYLNERGLYDQSVGRIREARQLAAALEDQHALLEIHREELSARFDRRLVVQQEEWSALHAAQQAALESLQEEVAFTRLYHRLQLAVLQMYSSGSVADLEALRSEADARLSGSEPPPSSAQAVRRYYQCQAAFAHLLGTPDAAFPFYLRAVEWWEQYPLLKEEAFHRYVIDVSNLVNAGYGHPGHAAQAQDWLDRLKREQGGGSYHHQKVIFFKLSVTSLLFYLNRRDFGQAHRMLPEILEGVRKFGMEKSIVLLGNVAIVYFLVEDYRRCLEWSDHIIRNLRNQDREDIVRLVRLLKLVSLFELGAVDALDAAVRSTWRHFKAQGLDKDSFEGRMLHGWLRKLFAAPLGEYRPVLTGFRAFLSEVARDTCKEPPLGVDELLIYVERRLAGGPKVSLPGGQ